MAALLPQQCLQHVLAMMPVLLLKLSIDNVDCPGIFGWLQ